MKDESSVSPPPECPEELTVRCSGDGAAARKSQGCLLFVASGDVKDRGKVFRLEAGEALIGRGGECQLTLHDSKVSRRHIQVSCTTEGIVVEDLGSTNGIHYLGQRIERAVLAVGTRFLVGGTTIDLLPLEETQSLLPATEDRYADLLGTSLPMRRLFALLHLLEQSEAPVLVEGETGTGKELVARALHDLGPRAGLPFVVIDCGTVPADLMEGELFGHRRGAFTGATSDRLGAFEAAHGGTVFLDELGELPLLLQPKLLRVLETGQIKRLGDVHYRPVDLRVVAATRRCLADEVAQGRFRDDLYYRIAVVRLSIPPLRERREDIPQLVRAFVTALSGGRMSRLSPEAETYLVHHDWPGNVRELRNVVQRVLAMQATGTSALPELGAPGREPPGQEPPGPSQGDPREDEAGAESGFREARARAVLSFERDYLERLWREAGGNVSRAARAAGIDRKYLRDLLRRHGLT